jgi:hypothetical protein
MAENPPRPADDVRCPNCCQHELIKKLQRAMAYEARITEAHYEGIKTFPKSRRRFAEEQVERMRMVARGLWPVHYDNDARVLDIEYREARRGTQSDGEA